MFDEQKNTNLTSHYYLFLHVSNILEPNKYGYDFTVMLILYFRFKVLT